MAAPAHRLDYTYADYLAFEASSNVKHEFLDGQIYAMAGGTPEHAALASAFTGLLFVQLRPGRCRAHDSDLRVRVPATGLTTYPDITVVCGPRELDATDPLAVTNPTLIVEVMSRSTEKYDRGEKFEHYRNLASLRQYVLVSSQDRSVEVWTRETGDRWTSVVSRDGAVADLAAIGARLDIRELYDAAAEPAA